MYSQICAYKIASSSK